MTSVTQKLRVIIDTKYLYNMRTTVTPSPCVITHGSADVVGDYVVASNERDRSKLR